MLRSPTSLRFPLVATRLCCAARCGATASGSVASGQRFVGTSYEYSFYKPGIVLCPGRVRHTLSGQHLPCPRTAAARQLLISGPPGARPAARSARARPAARKLATDDVRFVGIDIRDQPDSAQAFMQTFNVGYPSLNDPDDEIALAFHSTFRRPPSPPP